MDLINSIFSIQLKLFPPLICQGVFNFHISGFVIVIKKILFVKVDLYTKIWSLIDKQKARVP